jgi:hypothetical protein
MDYVFTHSILGLISCILFFTICNYGLEIINWILLGFIPGYILLTLIFSKKEDTHENTYESSFEDTYENTCEDTCKIPKDTCKIPKDTCKIPTDTCKIPGDTCKIPGDTCKIPGDTYKDSIGFSKNMNKILSCPAKPISLGTECGISRFT